MLIILRGTVIEKFRTKLVQAQYVYDFFGSFFPRCDDPLVLLSFNLFLAFLKFLIKSVLKHDDNLALCPFITRLGLKERNALNDNKAKSMVSFSESDFSKTNPPRRRWGSGRRRNRWLLVRFAPGEKLTNVRHLLLIGRYICVTTTTH